MEDQGVIKNSRRKMERLKRIVHGAMVRRKVRRWKKKEIEYKNWWDRSCTRKKREVKRIYRRWREGKVGKERFLEEKIKFKANLLKNWWGRSKMKKEKRKKKN